MSAETRTQRPHTDDPKPVIGEPAAFTPPEYLHCTGNAAQGRRDDGTLPGSAATYLPPEEGRDGDGFDACDVGRRWLQAPAVIRCCGRSRPLALDAVDEVLHRDGHDVFVVIRWKDRCAPTRCDGVDQGDDRR